MKETNRAQNVLDVGAGVQLCPFHPDDVERLHEVFLDREVKRYLLDGDDVERGWIDSVVADSRTDFDEGRGGMWSVVLAGGDAGTSALVGFVGVRDFFEPPRRQLIYALKPEFWGRGLATSAVRRVLRFLFEELGWERVEAAIDEPNAASVQLVERLGFEPFEPRGPVSGGGSFGKTLFFELVRTRWSGVGD